MSSLPVLEVSNLRKSYRNSFPGFRSSVSEQTAVDGLGFTVFPGDIYGFLGPNGAGKSTTIRMMLGLIRPDSGYIRYFGKSFEGHRSDCLRRIGAIVEKPDFYRYMSGVRNLRVLGTMSGADVSRKRIDGVLELVGLSGRGDDPVKNYSHGMKQRLGIAQAMLHDPELIVLDEPTTGLDPQGIVDLRGLILRLRDAGKTVFMSSHILSEIELVATRMVIISRGKAMHEGSVSDLLNSDDLLVEFSFTDVPKAREAVSVSRWSALLEETASDHLRFRLGRHQAGELNGWFCSIGIPPEGIVSRRRLEDFFMKLTR